MLSKRISRQVLKLNNVSQNIKFRNVGSIFGTRSSSGGRGNKFKSIYYMGSLFKSLVLLDNIL